MVMTDGESSEASTPRWITEQAQTMSLSITRLKNVDLETSQRNGPRWPWWARTWQRSYALFIIDVVAADL
ncbi:hypothetical protein C8034_v006985 [Colletotrichum sidae]|uniref:Uncharacterized protein n=1 Tax=Colletotrichum sidae TaxID=1347389 RepID=A0A4R8T455_9PEZI|nr:hypothetical protein C8034_v006985 [Colletotrichum sidae]